MPVYDYACDECDDVFEFEQSIKEEKGALCPYCGHFSRNRLISAGTTFCLRGDGWAADNYSKKSTR